MILIIAYGNGLRRDDGAGLVLGERLEALLRERGHEVERHSAHQLTPEMALAVAAEGVQSVIFVDTRVAGSQVESLHLEARRLTGEPSTASLGHHLGPEAVMTYARLLFQSDPPAWLVTVPGFDFGHGEGFSEWTSRAIASLPDLLRKFSPHWPLSDAP